jgi:hypothetical protein
MWNRPIAALGRSTKHVENSTGILLSDELPEAGQEDNEKQSFTGNP